MRTNRLPSPMLPSPAEILAFVADTPGAAGKREIARAFGLHGADKIALKALLKQMEAGGHLERSSQRDYHRGGGLPKVTVLRVTEFTDDGRLTAVPDSWDGAGAAPTVRMVEGSRKGALGLGDRVLTRIEDGEHGPVGHPMKRIERRADTILGILRVVAGRYYLTPTDKRARHEFAVEDPGPAHSGELVAAEPQGRPPRLTARIVDVLGDPFAPRAFSLIAIHEKGIPQIFPEAAIAGAEQATHAPLGAREDLTHLPFLTIDPADARDHDDAVWAAPDPDRPGHHQAIVAIADVSWFVRPASALDAEARKRGNSVYFPDRVVPMLPEALSADACSLVAGQPRAVIACHLTLSPEGQVLVHRFTRATIRSTTNIAYEAAQATIDAGAGEHHATLAPLWSAWASLAQATAARAPLALDLPKRTVTLDDQGKIAAIGTRARLDAHRLIEDFMIAANVAAALSLEAAKTPCMYRCHEEPARAKLIALKEYLATLGIPFALGQVVKPATFNRILRETAGRDDAQAIAEQVLRSQTQAYYAPRNTGHFGLGLASYGHFTSPIRRYADLVVHRALVRAHGLGEGGLTAAEDAALQATGEHISQTERRAMEAERDTMNRYIAAHLSDRVGETVQACVTGVARFGLFATVEGVGGDGLLPMSALGPERFHLDEAARALEGGGERYTVGQRLPLKLAAADPVTGALRFELAEGGGMLAKVPRVGGLRKRGKVNRR